MEDENRVYLMGIDPKMKLKLPDGGEAFIDCGFKPTNIKDLFLTPLGSQSYSKDYFGKILFNSNYLECGCHYVAFGHNCTKIEAKRNEKDIVSIDIHITLNMTITPIPLKVVNNEFDEAQDGYCAMRDASDSPYISRYYTSSGTRNVYKNMHLIISSVLPYDERYEMEVAQAQHFLNSNDMDLLLDEKAIPIRVDVFDILFHENLPNYMDILILSPKEDLYKMPQSLIVKEGIYYIKDASEHY